MAKDVGATVRKIVADHLGVDEQKLLTKQILLMT